jgi:hypothetical protein
MLSDINWNHGVFIELQDVIKEELEQRFKGEVYNMMPLTDTLYFHITLLEDDFISQERLKILAVHIKNKAIECEISIYKLNCVKIYFSV